MTNPEKISPFQPQTPVRPENFEGRKDIIERNLPYLFQSSKGMPTHFFIKGKRGMGKTSLAEYFKNIAEVEHKMVGIHVINDGVHEINDLIHQIVERLLNEIKKETWSDKIINTFKEHVKSIEGYGLKLEFTQDQKVIKNIKDTFAFFLKDIIDNFDNKRGLFIIIDDINGLSETSEFANWYKSFADTLAIEFGDNLPLTMVLTTYPENAQLLYEHNPSFNRLFKHIDVKGLNDSEIKDFFSKIFTRLGISIDKKAMDLMIRFSSGLPNMMQEIGDGVFWMNNDETIDPNDALQGIIRAGQEIGVRHLQPALDKSIRSERYLTIFKALGEDFTNHDLDKEYIFRKRDFKSKLNKNEQNAFSDFLKRAKKLKIIEYAAAPNSGVYKFTNNLYPIYLFIQSLENEISS